MENQNGKKGHVREEKQNLDKFVCTCEEDLNGFNGFYCEAKSKVSLGSICSARSLNVLHC